MIATSFKCKQSGNIVSFRDIDSIESMRKEPHYEEMKNEIKTEAAKDANAAHETQNADEVKTRVLIPIEKKKRGRPAKK